MLELPNCETKHTPNLRLGVVPPVIVSSLMYAKDKNYCDQWLQDVVYTESPRDFTKQVLHVGLIFDHGGDSHALDRQTLTTKNVQVVYTQSL